MGPVKFVVIIFSNTTKGERVQFGGKVLMSMVFKNKCHYLILHVREKKNSV